jgi:hypothetical protein
MALDFIENIYAKVNVELLYGLAILLPLLMEKNDLMKLAQVQVGIFVFMFNILSNLWWVFPITYHALDINDIQYLTFDCNGQHIEVKHLNQLLGVVNFVIIQMHTQVVEIVKN